MSLLLREVLNGVFLLSFHFYFLSHLACIFVLWYVGEIDEAEIKKANDVI